MKVALPFVSLMLASGLTMVTLYNTLVDANSWGSDIPTSIQTARDYYAQVDPRRFYLIVGPPTVVLTLLTTIVFWRDAVPLRLLFGTSAACYILIVVLTISYFVPRDLMLFRAPLQGHLEEIRAAASEWSRMNWARTFLGCLGVLCTMRGLHLYYTVVMETLSGR